MSQDREASSTDPPFAEATAEDDDESVVAQAVAHAEEVVGEAAGGAVIEGVTHQVDTAEDGEQEAQQQSVAEEFDDEKESTASEPALGATPSQAAINEEENETSHIEEPVDLALAHVIALLGSAEQKLSSSAEADSRRLANSTAWHAATKRLTDWLSANVHKRAGSTEGILKAGEFPGSDAEESPLMASTLQGAFTEEFMTLSSNLWGSMKESLEDLLVLREEREKLLLEGSDLKAQLQAKEIEKDVALATSAEKIANLESAVESKDSYINLLRSELALQSDSFRAVAQTIEITKNQLVDKDALLAELVTKASCSVGCEVTTDDDSVGNTKCSNSAEAELIHLREKLSRTESSLQAAYLQLEKKGSEVASLTHALDLQAEASERALNELCRDRDNGSLKVPVAQGAEALTMNEFDIAPMGTSLPTFAEASKFYLQGREEIKNLKIELSKLSTRADKVDSLESKVREFETHATQMVSSLAALEEETQQQRVCEKRLRGELQGVRAEKSTLVSQVVQLSLASVRGSAQQQEQHADAAPDSNPTPDAIESAIHSCLSVIYAATTKAAASSSSLVDSTSHQELLETHRRLKADIIKLGKDKDFLEKLVTSRKQRLQSITAQMVSAAIGAAPGPDIGEVTKALAVLATELATETRGSLSVVHPPSTFSHHAEDGLNSSQTLADAGTFSTISSALIENVALKATNKSLEVEVTKLNHTISQMKAHFEKPVEDLITQLPVDSSSTQTTESVKAVAAALHSLTVRDATLSNQNETLRTSIGVVSKALHHTRRDVDISRNSFSCLQEAFPVIANSVTSALENYGAMQKRLVESKEKLLSLKASLIELQQKQHNEQSEMRKVVEQIGQKRSRGDDNDNEDAENEVVGVSSTIGIQSLMKETNDVASNVVNLAAGLHGLKQLSACRKLVEIVASLENEIDAQRRAHASDIAKIGLEFVKNTTAAGGEGAAISNDSLSAAENSSLDSLQATNLQTALAIQSFLSSTTPKLA